MRKNLKFTLLGLGILAGGMLTSCSDNSDPTMNSNSGTLFGKAPKVVAYSGGHFWSQNDTEGTRANAGDGYIGNQNWENRGAESLTNITDEERQAVLDAISQKVTGSKISEDVVFPWTDYFLQDVISGQNGNFQGAGSNGTSSSSYAFEAWNTGASCSQQWWPGYDFENYEEVANSAHLNNYFQRQNADGSQTRINETTLMTGMQYGTYEEMKGKQFRWYVNCHENLHWYDYIVVQVDGSYYICFDFGCGYPENDRDGHPGKGAEHNDWDYNDWILKITPAGEQPDVWTGETTEPEPEPEDTCDNCGHESHGDICPDCPDDEGCNKKAAPANPAVTGDEVEINLTIEGEGNSVKQSHLSIHVRAATDVEVFIPCPIEYICPADDMAIVEKHLEEMMKHGGSQVGGTEGVVEGMVSHMYYKVGANYIDFTVEFVVAGVPASDGKVFDESGIYVWTKDINEDVINYLQRNYGDGITFELWNYFNDDVTFDMLKPYFDRSTVRFVDKEPDAYINAYNDTDTGEMYDRDCHVGIHESQEGDYNESFKGNHYNGSPYNDIYTNKNPSTKPEEEINEPPVY